MCLILKKNFQDDFTQQVMGDPHIWKQQIFSETFFVMSRAWNVFSPLYQEYKQNIVFLKTSTLASSLKEIERLILELK